MGYENHTLVEAFVLYHKVLMGASVRFNDVGDGFSSFMAKLVTADNQVSYRSGWSMRSAWTFPSSAKYAYEILAETTCHWEHRFRSRWFMIVHAVDNFVLPTDNVSLVNLLQRAAPALRNVAAVKVPIVVGFPGVNTTGGSNVLQRFTDIGVEYPFRNA